MANAGPKGKPPIPAPRRRRSIFSDVIPATPCPSQRPLTDYEQKLSDEQDKWVQLLVDKEREVAKYQNKELSPICDVNLFTLEDKKIFLPPNFEAYVAESKEFCKKADFFLQLCKVMDEQKNELTADINRLIDKKTFELVYKNIYNSKY